MKTTKPISTGPVAIDRMRPVPVAEDFAALKAETLTWLPVWCEGLWSDFNAHDPGIMILEQLLYGLTELPFRANLPIDQLLKRNERGEIPWNEDSLYAPTEILPMAPLTAADYARLLYDRIPEVCYAAIEVIPPSDLKIAPQIGGRLRAKLALSPKVIDPKPVLQRAQALLDQNVNLGERFESITELPPLYFTLQAVVTVAPGISNRAVGANMYSAVLAALQPAPRFRTLVEAMNDEPIDVALTGPLLESGVIEDADLPRLRTWPEAQTIAAQALLAVPGVTGVSGIDIQLASDAPADAPQGAHWFAPYPKFTVSAPKDAQPRPLGDAGDAQPRSLIRLVTFGPAIDPPGGTPPGEGEISAEFVAATHARGEVQFTRLLPAPGWLLPNVPDQAVTAIGAYYSIQDEFPPCFALMDGALPLDAPDLRWAQVRQLKGYLLVFEQLLANYLEQLEHTVDYFSNRPQTRSVFTQPLSTVPGVLPLIEGYPYDDANANTPERTAHAEAFWFEPANPYITGLRDAAETETQFLERRGRVLDQLLARFNENFPATPDEATFETIRNKEDLLAAYPALGYSRARAADFAQPAAPDRRRSRSGLEEKIQLLLRRDTQPAPSTLGHLTAHVRPEQPADFYFVIEPIRFLPTTDETVAGDVWAVPLEPLRASLFHTFVNWTYERLNSAFLAYAEDLVKENMPAHLEPWFIWLETQPVPSADANQFLDLFRGWAEAGYPTLRLAASSTPAAAGTLNVVADTPAARLLQWLLERRAKTPASVAAPPPSAPAA